jgi:hypothetical protein
VRGLVPLLALSLVVVTACTNPKDPRVRAREHRASAKLEAAVHRETPARIRSIGCVQLGDDAQICRVSFHRGRPEERWRLDFTRDSARIRRIVADPPRIVLWHLIGRAGLRMSRVELERTYGPPYYVGPEPPQYEVPGGVLFVSYIQGKVVSVATNSRRYRTRTGLGVGTRIPFRPGSWHGFRLGRDSRTGVRVWWRYATYQGRPVTAYMDATGKGPAPYRASGTGVVFEIGFYDGRMPP